MSRSARIGPVLVTVGSFIYVRRLRVDLGQNVTLTAVQWRKGKRRP